MTESNRVEKMDIEHICEQVHKAYCQYQIDHGKEEYWTKGDYSKLDDKAKEIDRYTVRAVIQALQEAGLIFKDEVLRLDEEKVAKFLKPLFLKDLWFPAENQLRSGFFSEKLSKDLAQTICSQFSLPEEKYKKYTAWCPECFDALEYAETKDEKGLITSYKYNCFGCDKNFQLSLQEIKYPEKGKADPISTKCYHEYIDGFNDAIDQIKAMNSEEREA